MCFVYHTNLNRIVTSFFPSYSITYTSIHLATHAGRCFFLTFLDHTGLSHALGFKLENCHSASALYRAVTEKHAFYSCETVRNAVTSQYIRDLKGTIASLFNENTALGKNYVFDIQRTCREVYDHTRRVMYQLKKDVLKETAKNYDSEKTLPSSSMDDLNDLLSEDCHSATCRVIFYLINLIYVFFITIFFCLPILAIFIFKPIMHYSFCLCCRIKYCSNLSYARDCLVLHFLMI